MAFVPGNEWWLLLLELSKREKIIENNNRIY